MPLPLTPVTQVSTPSGTRTSICFRLCSSAPRTVSQPVGFRRFVGTDLVVEYSQDGVGWTPLDFEPLSTEEGSQLTFTYRVTSKLPNAENLSIRFRQNGNACVFRIDDVCVAPKKYKK